MIEALSFLGQKFEHQKNIEETVNFLSANPKISKKIYDLTWAYRDIRNVIPQYFGKFGSGHTVPYNESFYEVECSYQLVNLCFYKYAFISLRNSLELGLLSVYWDKDDDSEKTVTNWHDSKEQTPFKKQILKVLSNIDTIKEFSTQFDIIEKSSKLYNELSDFTHTKGFKFTAHSLNNANFTRFNEKTVLKWIDNFEQVIQLLLTVHILKYPVALQYTPIQQKFGINGPFGTFLDTDQSEKIKSVLNPDELLFLQKISDEDENAKSLAEWVNSHPDISEEDFKKQLDDFDEDLKNINQQNRS